MKKIKESSLLIEKGMIPINYHGDRFVIPYKATVNYCFIFDKFTFSHGYSANKIHKIFLKNSVIDLTDNIVSFTDFGR